MMKKQPKEEEEEEEDWDSRERFGVFRLFFVSFQQF